jgi:uncharacterized membrane protein
MEVTGMGLSPEERKRIYEEEKARIEADEHFGSRPFGPTAGESSLNLAPNVAAVLCYLGFWITGIVFFVLEKKNKWVRFHAAQSIITFGSLSIIAMVFGWIPFLGHLITAILWIIGVVLWVVLIVKAYQGERFRIPIVADLAEAITYSADEPYYAPPFQARDVWPPSGPSSPPPQSAAPPPPPGAAFTPPQPPPPPPPFRQEHRHDHWRERWEERREERHSRWEPDLWHHRELRITGYVFAIAWCVILLVAFNFFNQYIAYYTYNAAASTWTWKSFFTSDINKWLPILNAALAVAIIGHLVMIFLNNRILRRAIHVINSGFGLAAVLTLLAVYPFDFSTNVIPNSSAAAATDAGVRIGLIVIAVGCGIGLLVRIIKLLVSIARSVTTINDNQ